MDSVPLLHLSDLHIGSVFANNAFKGLSGHHEHDIQLCIGLENGINDARKRLRLSKDDELYTVVSGDITANGLNREYAIAHTMLRGKFRMYRSGFGQFVGLDSSGDGIAVIPGNHDHWDGTYSKQGYNIALFPEHFRNCPWRKVLTGTSLTLELYGVDSNSGVTSTASSWAAQGSVSSASLTAVDKMLAARPLIGTKVVRAIMVHHSLAYTKGPIPRVLVPKALDKRSKDELLRLSAKHGVAAILTGHTHDFLAHPHSAKVGSVSRTVRELRCATTLQGPAARTGAGYLVHRIELDRKGNTTWSAWRYSWCGSGFELLDKKKPWIQFQTP